MSLRVDLIYPDEQRSGGVVSIKSFVRIGAIIVPCLIVLAVGWWVVGVIMERSELNVLENQWGAMEVRQREAKDTAANMGVNRKIVAELQGWEHASLRWHRRLVALIERVPSEIQLTSITVSQAAPERDADPSRAFSVRIAGRAGTPNAKQLIEELRTVINAHPAWTNGVESVEVAHYGADEAEGAGPLDRVFELEVLYAKREFK